MLNALGILDMGEYLLPELSKSKRLPDKFLWLHFQNTVSLM